LRQIAPTNFGFRVKQSNGWTRYGGSPYAWTIPLELPGTLLMRIGQTFHSVSILGIFGMITVLSASVITAYAVASCLFAAFSGKRLIWGPYHWRLVVIFLGLIWIPIREDWAEVYQYTVLY